MSKTTDTELSKLRWYCHRGMKELDVVLGKYLDTHYQLASHDELQAFKELLQLEDPVIFSLLTGKDEAKDLLQIELLKKLRI